VTYASDVEGRWDYFCNFVDHSKGLRFRLDLEHINRRSLRELELQLEDGWHFVFGGDACPKGPGTLRFLETMVRLKRKWPGRVHLLLGERDLDRASWFGSDGGDVEVRREELAHLGGSCTDDVTDSEVLKSYEDSMKPGGWMWEYLQLAQLGIQLGDTLFIYGEILSGNVTAEDVRAGAKHQEAVKLGMVPDDEDGTLGVHEWLKRLNAWVKHQINTWDLGTLEEPLAYLDERPPSGPPRRARPP